MRVLIKDDRLAFIGHTTDVPGLVLTDDDLHIVPVGSICHPEAVGYAEEWMALTGRPLPDIYIPESLRSA